MFQRLGSKHPSPESQVLALVVLLSLTNASQRTHHGNDELLLSRPFTPTPLAVHTDTSAHLTHTQLIHTVHLLQAGEDELLLSRPFTPTPLAVHTNTSAHLTHTQLIHTVHLLQAGEDELLLSRPFTPTPLAVHNNTPARLTHS